MLMSNIDVIFLSSGAWISIGRDAHIWWRGSHGRAQGYFRSWEEILYARL